jgi:carbon-monoxide dehydrogenase catalytic subunit
MCNMGPCRISPKAPRGACGAGADLIVARNILRWMAGAVASHGARSREVILALKASAEGRSPQPIKGAAKALAIAKALGIYSEEKSVEQMVGEIADTLHEDLSRSVPSAHRTIDAFASEERKKLWKELDIIPIGAYHEVFEALHRTGVGTDGDWRNVMKQFLRCGLAFSFGSVLGGTIAGDCLYGVPKRTRIQTNLGSINPDTVNIAIHGHSPVLAASIVELAGSRAAIDKARSRGAGGISLYGICCSGLNSLYRLGSVIPLSNAAGAELVLGTGAIDLWVADLQDIYPAIMEIANCFHTKVITTNDSCHLPGAEHIGFDHYHSNIGEAHELADKIINEAISNYALRDASRVFIPDYSFEAEVGFSAENLCEEFGGTTALLECLRDGSLRGIVNLVGCSNPKVLYEQAVVRVTDYLLKNGILVVTNGCASFPLLRLGYCSESALSKCAPGMAGTLARFGLPPVIHFGECLDNARASALFKTLAEAAGEPIRRMPFAFSSPEWSNEKGVGAALAFRLLGVNSYHCVEAPVGASDNVSRFFSSDTMEAFGAVMVVEEDPERLAAIICRDVEDKRERLGWKS